MVLIGAWLPFKTIMHHLPILIDNQTLNFKLFQKTSGQLGFVETRRCTMINDLCDS